MNIDKKRLGFIGLGMMGSPMAGRLCRAGYALTVFDIEPAQVSKFAAANPGVTAADTLNAFSGVEAVITMLPGSDDVDATVLGGTGNADNTAKTGLIDILTPRAAVIDMSSSQPLRSRVLADALGKKGVMFLDAPVSGGVRGAVNGTLSIMVGGEEAQFQRFSDVFESLGRTVTHVGKAGAGHALKALNNYVSAAGIIAVVEALHVGQEFGLDPAVMTDVFNSSTGQNYATTNKVKQYMLSGAFDSGFALQLMVKDLRTAVHLGDELDWDMRIGREVLHLWSEAGEKLERSADHTELYRYLQKSRK